MAVVYENTGNGMVRAYSNAGFMIHGGFPEADYAVAYDPEEAGRTYVETSIPVETPEPEPGPAVYSKLKILLAAREAGFLTSFISMIESDPETKWIWDASNTIEDNELLAAYLPSVAQALNKTTAELKAFLDENCLAD